MSCPGCGKNTNFDRDTSGTYCENCSSEQGITKLISDYFHRGYPYGAIVGLLSAAGVQISVRTLKRRLRSLGLKRKGQIVDEQRLRDVIRDEIEGAGQLSAQNTNRNRRATSVGAFDVYVAIFRARTREIPSGGHYSSKILSRDRSREYSKSMEYLEVNRLILKFWQSFYILYQICTT